LGASPAIVDLAPVANLAAPFFDTIASKYEGTRLGRQELNAEILEDTPGALWKREWIDRDRVETAPELTRIVVAIDPAMTSGEDADETGIIVAGISRDKRPYLLDDLSGRHQPHEWATKAIESYRKHQADKIVAEVNAEGEMVAATLKVQDANVAFGCAHRAARSPELSRSRPYTSNGRSITSAVSWS
jgi:phage terminase large subunit-like protein